MRNSAPQIVCEPARWQQSAASCGPALERRMTHLVDLHAYGVTAERGFLPIADPSAGIPATNSEWHQTARDLPALVPSGKIRSIIEALPEFRSEQLETEEDLEAAMRTLIYLDIAYV